ncbi:CG18624 [Drosophila busckii]|uniref:CG18624 n=1 Tax=Drosophila busckii TaxID=30019 RepID=A0A0M4EMS1_DROBS|nr:NADH dehydrogenase [ubiquinone] 1 beta subcomplex subunit 1 [Drosophila busckii]ALC49121.1 CG18624 [Drosophila busckii]
MVLGLDKRALWAALPLLGYAIGHFLDTKETERMTMFRDKSALYGRAAGSENQQPSW